MSRTITVVVQCVRGHTFDVTLPETTPGLCPHGVVIGPEGEPITQQVDLTCPACGKAYSVVGEVGTRTCQNPDCIKKHGPVRMLCALCEASKPEDVPLAIICPHCGGSASVIDAPPVRFTGVVSKVIPSVRKGGRRRAAGSS